MTTADAKALDSDMRRRAHKTRTRVDLVTDKGARTLWTNQNSAAVVLKGGKRGVSSWG